MIRIFDYLIVIDLFVGLLFHVCMLKRYFFFLFAVLVYKITGFHYLSIHLCHCTLLPLSPLPSAIFPPSLVVGLFPCPNNLPLCVHVTVSHIHVCICVYEIYIVHTTEGNAVVCLPLYSLSPSLPPFRPLLLYICIVFLYTYAHVYKI